MEKNLKKNNLVITYNGKESEKQYMYIYTYIYVYMYV